MFQLKGQDKTTKKQLNEVDRQPFRKRIQNNDSEDDQGSQEKHLLAEDARNVYQRPTRPKVQTEMNNTLEGINSRITEAEK